MPLIRSKSDSPGAAPPPETRASLTSPSAEERWRAARAVDDPSSVAALAGALANEADSRVREALFTALALIATVESADVVMGYLRVDDSNLRTGAMDALRAMPRAVAARIPALLADKDSDVRLLACDLMRDIGGEADAARLCALIETEPHTNVCAAAIEALAEIGDARAAPSLQRCAQRFPGDPFLPFAVEAVVARLRGVADIK